MFDTGNSLIEDLERTWRALDSFWRERTDSDTYAFVQRQQQSLGVSLATVLDQIRHAKQVSEPDVPPFIDVPWFLVRVLSDNVTVDDAWRVGDGSIVGEPGLTIGEGGSTRYVVPLPAGAVDVGAVYSSPLDAGVALTVPDFEVADGELAFTTDPFTTFETYVEGPNTYVDLWLRGVKLDFSSIWLSRGYPLGARAPSSETYSRSVELLYEYVRTRGKHALEEGAALAVGAPYARYPENVLSETATGGGELVLITDQSVYRYPDTQYYPFVFGEQSGVLTELSLSVLYGNNVPLADFDVLPGIEAPYAVANEVYTLTFENRATTWSVDDTVSPIRVEFPVGGDGAAQFWDDVYARSSAAPAGEDLATLLGITSSLDSVAVNPLAFFLANFHPHDYIVYTANLPNLSSERTPFLDWVQPYISPGTRLVLLNLLGGAGTDQLDLATDAAGAVSEFLASAHTDDLDLAGLTNDPAPFVSIS